MPSVCFSNIVFLASTVHSAALDAQLPDAIKAKGKIIIGINGIFPPMEFKEPGKNELIGFDVDLAKAIGDAWVLPLSLMTKNLIN